MPLEQLQSKFNHILLSNSHAHTASRCACLSLYVYNLPVKFSLLGKWQQLDVFEVVDKVAGDLVYLPVDDGDLRGLLALGEHVEVDAEGLLDHWKLGVNQIVLVYSLLVLLKLQQVDNLRHWLYLRV